MTYEQMIKTECTDERYDAWSEYRSKLTDYILESAEHFYRKEKLKKLGLRRLPAGETFESLVKEQSVRPTLAIWGAGGCNDIDIVRLATHFRLVLIDHNMEQLQKTRMRFGLSEMQCACVDLQFWDITDDDYKMVEAMLKDGMPDEAIVEYVDTIVAGMQAHAYEMLPKFDFSICVGLASQLNARLGMLLTLYERSGILVDYVKRLNALAVGKLTDAIEQMTKCTIVFGYEVKQLADGESIFTDQEAWSEECSWPPENMYSEVSGNDFLSDHLAKAIVEKKFCAQSYEILTWPFADERNYLMIFGAFDWKKG